MNPSPEIPKHCKRCRRPTAPTDFAHLYQRNGDRRYTVCKDCAAAKSRERTQRAALKSLGARAKSWTPDRLQSEIANLNARLKLLRTIQTKTKKS